ncbi:MAG: beta-lactamase [Candidatus Saccharibacteria bacterium]|nr:beta-lactamase [Candidatus Saccharibacteria bacterium]
MRHKTEPLNQYYAYSPRLGARAYSATHVGPMHQPAVAVVPQRKLATIITIVAVAVCGFVFLFGGGAKESAAVLNSVTESKQKQPEKVIPPPVDTTAMQAEIDKIIAANPKLQISVATVDINADKQTFQGVDAPYIAASVSKVISAIYYLQGVEKGKHTLDTKIGGSPAGPQIEKMITESDNQSWWNLNDYAGRPKITAYGASIGLQKYDANTNTILTADVALLLKKLYKRELLNEEHTALLLSYMERANKKDFIAASVPTGVKVHHKAGWLDDRSHDAAIIDNGKNPYVLVIFTKGNKATYTEAKSIAVFKPVTTATVNAFITSPKTTLP